MRLCNDSVITLSHSGGNKVKIFTAYCEGQVKSQEHCFHCIAKLFLYLDIVRDTLTYPGIANLIRVSLEATIYYRV